MKLSKNWKTCSGLNEWFLVISNEFWIEVVFYSPNNPYSHYQPYYQVSLCQGDTKNRDDCNEFVLAARHKSHRTARLYAQRFIESFQKIKLDN